MGRTDHRLTLQLTQCLIAGTTATLVITAGPALAGTGDDTDTAPETLVLEGKVRDFHERSHPEGHPDMERKPTAGFGLYCGNIAMQLGDDGKPVFSGNGFKVMGQWRDHDNRPICYALYSPSNGDSPGSVGPSNTGGISSSETFAQWFDDVPGVNMSAPLSLTLYRQDDGSYVFDDKLDPMYEELDGFFPIEDQLFGNPGGSPDRNFHFTFELHTQFTYDASSPQSFRFVGDDDVWVFVDGRLVIDLGGVHSATEQWVDLARLGLDDGETYDLDFFFAERHRTQSNFRIETTLMLESAAPQSVTAQFD